MQSRLFTTFYPERHPRRNGELTRALSINTRSFDAVMVLCEGDAPPNVTGLTCRHQDRRQTYADVVHWAREVAGEGDLTVIANCDIEFPERAVEQLKSIGPNDMWALSRYERSPSGALDLYDMESSQDVWAFRGRPRLTTAIDVFFGVPGCENKFAHACYADSGYLVSNPSKSIATIHHHHSRLRTETNRPRNRLPGPYLFVAPSSLGESPGKTTIYPTWESIRGR